MGFLILAGALLLTAFGFAFYSYSFSLDEINSKLSRTILIITGILGAILSCLSSVLFFFLLSRSNADVTEKVVIEDSFVLFASVDTAIIAIGLAVTLISSLMKSFLRPMIPVVLPLWGIVSLFWTAVCCVWSDFESFSASVFVIVFGVGAAFLLSFSALPQMLDRIKILSDPEKKREIVDNLREKRAKRESRRLERKRLREKKNRLRHPKK